MDFNISKLLNYNSLRLASIRWSKEHNNFTDTSVAIIVLDVLTLHQFDCMSWYNILQYSLLQGL